MKAVIWTNYGLPDVLQLGEVDKPSPKENEVLIRIHATTVTAGDCEMRSLKFPLFLSIPMRLYMGLFKPTRITIPGMELAGEVETTGKGVSLFKPGDQVFGSPGFRLGTYAEYICLPEKPGEMDGILATKPSNLSYEEAAAVPVGGIEALHFLRQARIQDGETVLIIGAGGSIGTYAVQLARYYGAEVTGVDRTEKLDLLRSIGADHVIDYTQDDFTLNDMSYDVIFDVVGKSSFSRCISSLKPDGRYLLANPRPSSMLLGRWTSASSNKKVIIGAARNKIEDLLFLKELIEARVIKPVIDRRYPLEQIVEAHRYVETGQKKGNVVIRMPFYTQVDRSKLEQTGHDRQA
jgi:NADPH:quinone reductase-like Zn-dependent oxidoreductase